MPVLPEYDPNILQRRLAQELAIAGQQQALQDRAIGLQLEQQLAPLRMQEQALQVQKLQQALNPAFQEEVANRALQRELIGAVASGRNPGLIIQPSISPEIQAARAIAETEAGIPQTSYPSSDFRQILPSIGGIPAIGFSPTSRQAAIKEATNQKIAEIEARAAASGISGKTFVDAEGNVNFIPTRMIGGEPPTASIVRTTTGAPVKAAKKGELTLNNQNKLLADAGTVGLNPDDPIYFNPETKTYDFTRLSIDYGKAARRNKIEEDRIKAEGLTGETRNKIANLNAVDIQLGALKDEIGKIAEESEPGLLDAFIASEVVAPATGGLSALYQRGLKYFQSEESKNLELRRSIIQSAITSAISGLAVSVDEAKRLGFLPRPEDSFGELVRKAAVLEEYVNNQRIGLSQGSSITGRGGAPATPSQGAQAAGAPSRITTKAQFDALPSGSPYIGKNGRTYRKP